LRAVSEVFLPRGVAHFGLGPALFSARSVTSFEVGVHFDTLFPIPAR
jgi:hypothetical protein